MKTKLISLLSFLLITTCIFARAPQFEWAAGFGGTSTVEGRSVAVVAAGNIYTLVFFIKNATTLFKSFRVNNLSGNCIHPI